MSSQDLVNPRSLAWVPCNPPWLLLKAMLNRDRFPRTAGNNGPTLEYLPKFRFPSYFQPPGAMKEWRPWPPLLPQSHCHWTSDLAFLEPAFVWVSPWFGALLFPEALYCIEPMWGHYKHLCKTNCVDQYFDTTVLRPTAKNWPQPSCLEQVGNWNYDNFFTNLFHCGWFRLGTAGISDKLRHAVF